MNLRHCFKACFWCIPLLYLLTGCDGGDPPPPPESVTGYRPVYGNAAEMEIKFSAAIPVTRPGKIYRYNNYLLVNEVERGIHFFDNTDPSQPIPLGFLTVFGNTDMAIRNDVLYANHRGELVALRIVDENTFEEKGRLRISRWSSGMPAPSGNYFECIDPSKGIVLSWQKTTLSYPQCYAF